jgi:rhamnose utilization protein RhaD (predicted bifunctional aldolase and dehydrogenase)/NAD(P)-dependent dehydrogenase (short-subunit alcohol dehydrogenase family)
MLSRWNDAAAAATIERYGKAGVDAALAVRTYSTRLLGCDPNLVLHGGGNTSLKTRARDLLGEEHAVLCVKGSGADMAVVEPAGLPAVKLDPLRRLKALGTLEDTAMVAWVRANLLDPAAPTPSVETLLHAFLPHTFIDHTHAAAVLSLSDQPDGEALLREVYGRQVGIVPYVMPGFGLAKLTCEVFEGDPEVEGLILHKHGVVTFGASAREAYERMIDIVSRAERRLERDRRQVFAPRPVQAPLASVAAIAPILRGALSAGAGAGAERRFVLTYRTSPAILNYVDGAELANYARRGVVTPDHVIRTKNIPLVLPPAAAGDLDRFAREVRAAVAHYVEAYDAMFARESARSVSKKLKLDPLPRVALVPGLGLFAIGPTRKDAAIAADLAENAIAVVTDAEAIGRFEPPSPSDVFDVEYWSLEQAKLRAAQPKPLGGHVAVITGAGSGIGRATAHAFASEGAAVAILDRDGDAARRVAADIDGLALLCDVTQPAEVTAAFARIAEHFGGADIVVSNAGAAWQGSIGDVGEDVLRASFELNFFAHQSVAKAAVDVMLRQAVGGVLLFNVSKQAVNPGANFGPYGLPKAATLALLRQYAIEYGSAGIRANGVNADRVRTGMLTDALIAERAAARGLNQLDYVQGNLLRREVRATDVAEAFVALAKARATTAHVMTVDGGNIAAALR